MPHTTIHLICNAHLDPVWLWQWPDGAAEAISTFRTAAELCEEHDSFIFNHNEVVLYDWIREYEPELFHRIQRLVRAGKWHIMGGWFLQPDCNLPSGESFVRHILVGRQFFKRWFDAEPRTAINFDPFGHSRGLVQILAKSGYNSYLFGRPRAWELYLPDDEFLWTGFDGSIIMANRIRGWYLTPLGQARQQTEKRIPELLHKESGVLLWGVGDHGGGPSKKDVEEMNALIAERKDVTLMHSTPEAFFYQLEKRKDALPKWDKSINPWATGCYTSQIRVKQKHRLLENEYFSVEKMLTIAAANKLLVYPGEELQDALRDLLFGQFHDILPGSSIQPAEEDALRLFDHGLEICSRLKTRAFFALAGGMPKAESNTIPILVFNPHPFPSKTILETEFCLAAYDASRTCSTVHMQKAGKAVPCQVEQEASNMPMDFRKKVAFVAELDPQQMNRFDCTIENLPSRPRIEQYKKDGDFYFTTNELDIIINGRTGLFDKLCVNGIACAGKRAFQPLIIEDIVDSWARFEKRFDNVLGAFEPMLPEDVARFCDLPLEMLDPLCVIEDGPVRTIVEVLYTFDTSTLIAQYKFPKIGTEIEVALRVYWNEKTKMLKLNIPMPEGKHELFGQVAYGTEKLSNNGDEAVVQKWCAVVNKKMDFAFTCINNGTYGVDFSSEGLRLTLLRSAVYAGEDVQDLRPDRYSPRMDQGERFFRFWFNAGSVEERLSHIDREAMKKNEEPYILSFFPPGLRHQPKPIILIKNDIIQLTALKFSEDSNDIIVRLFNPTNKPCETICEFPIWGLEKQIRFGKFEIKSFKIDVTDLLIRETDLLERNLT